MPSALRALERLLLPNGCVVCDRLVEGPEPDTLVCSRCRWRLRGITGGCARCHQPLPLIGACRFCAGWPVALEWVRSAVWLGAEAREIVHHLKYEGFTALAGLAADITCRFVPPPAAGVLVPVPLAPKRLRARGYNQALLLARQLGARWHLPVDQERLTRTQEAASQTALTPDERLANVAGAFRVGQASGAGRPGPVDDHVIIVDDVLTTGATLTAAATALERGGCHHLGAVTFTRALPYAYRLNP